MIENERREIMGSIQWMLLGISIILIGGFLLLEPSMRMEAFKDYIIFVGLIPILIGFFKGEDT